MKTVLLTALLVLAGIATPATRATAAEPWQDALAAMPLATNTTLISRTNTVGIMLGSFQSNSVIKGLILMPGATDELYFFRRVNVPFAVAHPTLLDCLTAITNQTHILATVVPPFLVLHSTEDFLDGFATVKSPRAEARLKGLTVKGHLCFNDRDWDNLQPVLSENVRANVLPGVGLTDSWHFYRHTFTAWNLTQWELLEATAMAGKTQFELTSWTATFTGDRRHGAVPSPETIKMAE